MNTIDLVVISGYFGFILIAAWLFKRFSTDASQFIRGGGAMMWWMAGSTAFMTQFSAWTFTGAAAKAYEDGFPVLLVFWGNALGFFIAAAFFAGRFRKLRVDTPMQVIRQRFGFVSEQVYTWLQFPLTTLSAAIWLNGLAIFVAAVFQVELSTTILLVGVVVTIISVSGGSWSVSATNVIQLILLMAITMVVGMAALIQAGGPMQLMADFPAQSLAGNNIQYWQIFVLWGAVMLTKQSISTNNAMTCYRFLVTSNEKEARKAALFTAILFIVGPVLWFVPPWVTATYNIDLAVIYPNLDGEANNAAYLYFVDHFMPAGVLGLIMAAMIAATVSPMTTALNRNAGIFVRNVYQTFASSEVSDKTQLKVGKIATVINGILATVAALIFASLDNIGFFDLLMLVGALLQIPLAIPALLGVIFTRTPDWSGWATLIVGLSVSAVIHFGYEANWFRVFFAVEQLSAREIIDLKVITAVIAQVIITGGFFMATSLFYRPSSNKRNTELSGFRMNMRRSMTAKEQMSIDNRQNRYLSRLVTALAACCLPLMALTDTVAQAAIFAAIAALMWLASRALAK